jgi:hypothetical protein
MTEPTYANAQTAWTSLMSSFSEGTYTFSDSSGTTYTQALLNTSMCNNLCYNPNGNCGQTNFASEVIGYLQTVQAYYSYNYSVNEVPCSDNSPGCLFYNMMRFVYSAFTATLANNLNTIFKDAKLSQYNFDSSTYRGVTSIVAIDGCDSGNLKGVTSIVNAWMTSGNIQLPYMLASELPE